MSDEFKNVVTFVKRGDRDHAKHLALRATGDKTPAEKRCKHSATEIDAKARTLECSSCGCYLDPFDWVLSKANLGESILGDIDQLYEDRDRLRNSVESLLKEEKNVKARLRTAKDSLAFIENDIKKAGG